MFRTLNHGYHCIRVCCILLLFFRFAFFLYAGTGRGQRTIRWNIRVCEAVKLGPISLSGSLLFLRVGMCVLGLLVLRRRHLRSGYF